MRKIIYIIMAVAVVCLAPSVGATSCGDFNDNGTNDIADLIYLVNHMFQDGPPLPYPPAADCNGDGQLDIADLICWVVWMYQGGTWPPQCPFVVWGDHVQFNSGCLGDSVKAFNTGSQPIRTGELFGYLYLEVDGSDLLVHHDGAYYQCCLDYVVEFVMTEDNVITGFESDTGALCDCYCSFHLISTIQGLAAGHYTVVLIGIEGDTVGVDTTTIPDGPGLIDYGDSGCLPETRETDPNVSYSYDNGTLTLEHVNAYLNCGAVVAVEFAAVADTIRFFELNVSDTAEYCMCYFDIWAEAGGINPGDYVLEVYQQEFPDYPMILIDRRTLSLR